MLRKRLRQALRLPANTLAGKRAHRCCQKMPLSVLLLHRPAAMLQLQQNCSLPCTHGTSKQLYSASCAACVFVSGDLLNALRGCNLYLLSQLRSRCCFLISPCRLQREC